MNLRFRTISGITRAIAGRSICYASLAIPGVRETVIVRVVSRLLIALTVAASSGFAADVELTVRQKEIVREFGELYTSGDSIRFLKVAAPFSQKVNADQIVGMNEYLGQRNGAKGLAGGLGESLGLINGKIRNFKNRTFGRRYLLRERM